MMGKRYNRWYKWNGNICHNCELRDGRNCVRTSGWDGKQLWADGGTGKFGKTPYGGTKNSRDRNKMP